METKNFLIFSILIHFIALVKMFDGAQVFLTEMVLLLRKYPNNLNYKLKIK